MTRWRTSGLREAATTFSARHASVWVVDASVAVKWIVDEPLSEAARALAQGSSRLFAPDVIKLEVASALLRLSRKGLLAHGALDDALARLTPGVVDVAPTTSSVDDAIRITESVGGSTIDATYVAFAAARGLPLITCDTQMAAVARAAGVRVQILKEAK